ncbi:MAG: DUF1360 domain-containing protein [Rubrobacteraceae bacterium]
MSDQVRQAEQDNKGTTDIFAGYGAKDQELSSYAALAALFNLIFAVFLLVVRGTGRTLPERVETKDIILLGVAAHKLSFVVSNDAVTSVIRAPFTERQDKQSPKSIDEKPRGSGLRRSIGELLTCQFCLGMWLSSFFTYGLILTPRVTRLIATVFAVVTVSDHLHQTYKALAKRA